MRQLRRGQRKESEMSEVKTAEQRLSELEIVAKPLILFNKTQSQLLACESPKATRP